LAHRRYDPSRPLTDSRGDIVCAGYWCSNCTFLLREVLMLPVLYLVIALIVVALVARGIKPYLPADGHFRVIPNVVLTLLVVGVVLFLINTYIPMAESIKVILNIVVVVATCVGVLKAVGLWDPIVRTSNRIISSHKLEPPSSGRPA
jgi:predicted membrane protein